MGIHKNRDGMGWDCRVVGGMAGRRREMWDLIWDPVWDNTGKDNLGTCAEVGSPSPAYRHYVDQKWGLQTDQQKHVHGRLIV